MPLSREEEIRLVREIQQDPSHDNPAFTALYNAYARTIYGFIRIRSRSDEDAEDIAHDAWLRFWKKLHRYDPARSPFMAYIRVIALHAAVDYYNSRKRSVWGDIALEELAEELDRAPELASLYSLPGLDPEPPKIGAGTIRDLWRIIFEDTGPPHQIIVFILRYILDQKPAKIDLQRKLTLFEIEEQLKSEFLRIIKLLSEAEIDELFRGLHQRLKQPLEVTVKDETSRSALGHLLSRIAGGTKLEEYYKGEPSTNIGQWCYSVKRRVVKAAIKRGIGGILE